MTEPIASALPTPPPGSDEVAELTDRWHRALAEVENTRKAADRDTAALLQSERLAVSAAWLPVLDHLDLALRHADADPQSIVAGVQQVREQAVRILSQLGFEPIDTPGVPFDPQRHEAAEAVRDTSAEPGTVVRVLRPGFAGGDRLLRPAVVVVNALPELPRDTTAGTGDDARRDGEADGG
ncbi:nucleotide exchange factor GrpE [Dactylosporangium sucinum]|uniref:Protein GrpE n=1 Tax=Dactylosporangium sucinum TaxID=1424081 RepID=A0A917X5T6_9ACTN|nr:nucleotide exchange factor GrpE [Dactylosporangium sucinum]GGM72775.1 protein GrpE [Dactylosporangium sucinum]